MTQRPKPEVRAAILKAAAEAFADAGFERAALGEIVERAGTSIGNFYKYFANKDAVFSEFIPRGFTTELKSRIQAQVEAARSELNLFELGDGHPYRRASEELVSFALAHRNRVVFLLLRAQGTKHERFASEVVRLFVELALEHARVTSPRFPVTPASKRTLTRLYTAFVATLGAILAEERAEPATRQALALQSIYHLSGLKALFDSAPPEEVSE